MRFVSSFPVVIRALKANALRTTLTTLGVVIGVFIVITTVSLGEGAKNFILKQISSFGVGANTLAIYGAPETEGGGGAGMMMAMLKSSITYRDIEALQEKLNNVKAVIPAVSVMGEFQYGQKKYQSSLIIGTSEDYEKLIEGLVACGRFFNRKDIFYRKRVIILGSGIAKELFGAFPAIGEEIKVSGKSFKVIGVAKKMDSAFGMDMNAMSSVPITTAQDVFKTDEIMETWVVANSVSIVPKVASDIEKILVGRHGKEDFQVRLATDMLNQINATMGVLTLVVSAIAAISLLVGGIGIMNIMLVSVTERIKEIGIRKSVGARRADIFMQFLLEAMTISFMGGFFGVILGTIVLLVASKFINIMLLPSANAVILAFSFSLFVGVVSGVYPAMRAAQLEPVEALRS